MKKLALILPLLLVGCDNPKAPTEKVATPTSTPAPVASPTTVDNKKVTISQIINQFKADNLPIGKVVEQTAETDPNHKLGRPNEYIASAQFEDTRLKQLKADSATGELGLPKGGTIEIFNNSTDLQQRKKHIDMVFQAMPMAKQYVFIKNNVMLRVEFELTPEQAKAYENSLNKIA